MTKEPQRAPEFQAGPAGTSNADKARALIALLESGGGAGAEGIPAARLRDWARDLVETVERAAPPAPARKPEPRSEPEPQSESQSESQPEPRSEVKPEPRLTASRGAPPRLFTKAPPVLVDRAPPAAPVTPAATASAPPAPSYVAPPVAPPPVAASPVAAPVAAYSEAARASAPRMTLGAPVPHMPPQPQTGGAARPAILSRHEVDRLVASIVDPAGDPASLGREHPAIVALTLLGKPTLKQAAVLRALPGGQMRAVHRALRQLEARPA